MTQEISNSGIHCKAITDIGSLEIEETLLQLPFAMSPRIVTNRGCVGLEGNNTVNIDFIQIVQKN